MPNTIFFVLIHLGPTGRRYQREHNTQRRDSEQ
jgi:hypothetical protein